MVVVRNFLTQILQAVKSQLGHLTGSRVALLNVSQHTAQESLVSVIKYIKFNKALDQTIEMATLAMKSDRGVVGVPTGLTDLDEKLGGLHKSDLVIIAGRPSMGKTALATNIAYYAARNIHNNNEKTSVAFFS